MCVIVSRIEFRCPGTRSIGNFLVGDQVTGVVVRQKQNSLKGSRINIPKLKVVMMNHLKDYGRMQKPLYI